MYPCCASKKRFHSYFATLFSKRINLRVALLVGKKSLMFGGFESQHFICFREVWVKQRQLPNTRDLWRVYGNLGFLPLWIEYHWFYGKLSLSTAFPMSCRQKFHSWKLDIMQNRVLWAAVDNYPSNYVIPQKRKNNI